MKRFKVLNVLVLILLLCITGCSQSQDQNKTEETADDLLIKFIEYFDKGDMNAAFNCINKALELDPKKLVYIEILKSIGNGKFAEALKLLEKRKDESPAKKELKVTQILTAHTHFRWAEEFERKYDYRNAIAHYEAAYDIDIVYRYEDSAKNLNNIGLLYDALGRKQKALEYFKKAFSICREVGYRSGEATVLNNIGMVYDSLGQKQEALKYYETALPIVREVGNRSGEATTLNNIGLLYSDLGQKQKALEYYEKARPILREVKNRSGEASNLSSIGMVYSDIGQKQKALNYLEMALSIVREVGNRPGEAFTLNNIGGIYFELDQKQEALEYFNKAFHIFREVGNRSVEATTLSNIGGVHYSLGQKQKALEYYEKALLIHREVGNRSGESKTLNNFGLVYSDLGQNREALEYYEKALLIDRQTGDRPGEATSLNNIGLVYSNLGQNRKALECYEKALPIYTSVGNRFGEATALNNIGFLYSNLGQKQDALEYYEKALLILREVGNRSGEATVLNNIGLTYSDPGQNQKALAIFYGKQAVNTLQYLRHDIDNLAIKTKLKYLISSEDYYRNTASLMIYASRIAEAQQVLEILKDEEYFAFVRRNRSAYTPQYNPIEYTGFERNWIDRQNAIVKKISSISSPYHVLLIKKTKDPGEEKKLADLKRNLDKAKKEYRDFLVRMKKEFETYENREKPDIDALIKQSSPLKEYLKSLDRDNNEKTAVLHSLVYKGRISVIITTTTSQTVKQGPSFDEKEFNIMIYNYRDLIKELARLSRIANPPSTTTSKIVELSRQKRDIENNLYRLIFHPVDQYLKQYGAVNLLVSLDGVLHYIPLASLWDGEHYLVQRYRFVLLTPSSLKRIAEKPVTKNKILGMGASKGGKGFKPLPFVGKEIRAIVHDREKGYTGLIEGHALIDKNFTRETMVNSLKTSSYPLVHIASHFKFSPGNETDNQLLLGDGTTISLSDIRKEGKLFDRVKLLVLSACQTGIGGNGKEIDGFGRLAQQCGAGSVIASLWSVDDESTKELMVTFYRLLKEGKVSSKIEALRLAQLQLAGLEDMISTSKEGKHAASGKKTVYSNPYYWAPFIMMGNWR